MTISAAAVAVPVAAAAGVTAARAIVAGVQAAGPALVSLSKNAATRIATNVVTNVATGAASAAIRLMTTRESKQPWLTKYGLYIGSERRLEISGGSPTTSVEIIYDANQPNFVTNQIIQGDLGAISVFENGTELK